MALPEESDVKPINDARKDGPPSAATAPLEMEAPLGAGASGNAPPGVHLQVVNDVLYSEIGINTLLARLKQSIASANDFAGFLKKRALLEREHSEGLKKISKATSDSARSSDSRQGSYSRQLGQVTAAHDRMADNGMLFAGSLQAMHDELNELAATMERSRKHWKHEGLSNEKRVKDAEALMDKAKARYDSSAESYEKVRTGDASGRSFGIKGPKSAEQREEDLKKKLDGADTDYRAKVEAAQLTRQENINNSRPQAVRALQEFVIECDNAVTLQLQKYAALSEKLLVSNGMIVCPMRPEGSTSSSVPSMREVIQGIDNDKDFHTYIASHSAQVPPKASDIKYERHAILGPSSPTATSRPAQPPTASATTQPTGQTSAFGVRTPTTPTAAAASQTPSSAQAPTLPPSQQNVPQSHMQTGGMNFPQGRSAPPNGNYRGPSITGPPASQPQQFPPQQASRQAYGPPNQQAPGMRAPYQTGPQPPSTGMQNGPNGTSLAPNNPVFRMTLDALFRRDDSAVPLVVYQCIQAVDLFGLEVEGIYRLSGNAAHIQELRAAFDHDSTKIDFRNPAAFRHDVNSVAGLLKTFFRELPVPLMTNEHYMEFIEAAKVEDEVLRRDSLHAIINNLPDPNYATMRALVLHLNRVKDKSAVNRMTTMNLATCFAPTIMGPHRGAMQDSSLQIKVVDTIIQNTFQIFDED